MRRVVVLSGVLVLGWLICSSAAAMEELDLSALDAGYAGAPATGVPYVTNLDPQPGAEDVDPRVEIRFDLMCSREIDASSVLITVNGGEATPEFKEIDGGLSVSIPASQPYAELSEVVVEVEACAVDDALPPAPEEERCMAPFSYSFFIGGPRDVPPVIRFAGYGSSWISGDEGGKLQLIAVADDEGDPTDVLAVRVHYDGLPTPILLRDDGEHGDFAPGDNIFGIELEIEPGFRPSSFLLQLRASDRSGTYSDLWPYLSIEGEFYRSPPASPSPEEMMAIAMFGDLGEENPHRPRVLYAGYDGTKLSADQGGVVSLLALVDSPVDEPIERVELYLGVTPTGVELFDDGEHGDYAPGDRVYGLQVEIDGPVPPGDHLLSIVAEDAAGRLSPPWPYLVIH
jgi:hypothetical protein